MRNSVNLDCRLHQTIHELDLKEWERCMGQGSEGFDYHARVERAGISGFELGWYSVHEGHRLLCVVPTFNTQYDLMTTAHGRTRATLERMRSFVPGRMTLGLACLGAPVTERCQIGICPLLCESDFEAVFEALIERWERDAAARGVGLLGIKDLCDGDVQRFGSVLTRRRYAAVASLPVAVLPISFASIDDYFCSLSAATRKDLRRKLKARSRVTAEDTRDVAAVLPEIMAMYQETRERSDWAFEELSADYFRELVSGNGDGGTFVLYRAGGELIGANLLVEDDEELIDKFFVMRADKGRDLNLYFVSWVHNIERCLNRGLRTFVAGAAAYDTKLRLGCRLQRRWLYYRHRNPAANLLLRVIAPLLAVDQPVPPDAPCWEPLA